MLTNSLPGPSAVTSSADIRKALAGLVVRSKSTGLPRAGVFPRDTNTQLVTPSGSGSITVAVDQFNGATERGGGALLLANDAASLVTFGEAPIANARIDVLWFKQNEADYGDTDDEPVFGITVGTPDADPDVPAVTDDGAVPLIEIFIPAGAVNASSSGVTITEVYPFTCLEGGTLLVRDLDELNAWQPHEYSTARLLDSGETYELIDGTWVQAGGTPTGAMLPFAGSAAPTGFLLCDGTAVSRTVYARLFTVIGTAYGAGNGSTTFGLPNLKGRVPVGRDAAQTDFDTLGETGGAKTVTLTTDQMPSHTHRQVIAAGTGAALSTRWNYSGEGNALLYPQEGVNVDSAGGGAAHQNMPPYQIANYIIKV